MDFKGKIFDTLVGKLSLAFLLAYTLFYTTSEIIYAAKISSNTAYFSVIFILIVLICTGIKYFFLRKLEQKYYVYIIFTLPVIIFSIIRFIDLFSPASDHISEIVFMLGSFPLVIAFLVTVFFASEKRIHGSKEKKREEIVKSVLESQDRYKEALERKKEDWEKVIEEK